MPTQLEHGPGRLSIVFVIPRYHTNLFYATKALTERGHTVRLICAKAELIEDHSVVEPHYVNPRTSFAVIAGMLRDFSPDLLFIRKVPRLSRRFFLASVLLGIRTYAYDQNPLSTRRSIRKMAFDIFRGRPIRRITPVLGLDRSAPPDTHAVYLPFPVERSQEDRRSYTPDRHVRILCVGKLGQPRKNHRVLVDALTKLESTGDFSLTIVGASRRGADSLYRDVQSGRLADRVRIIPDVPFRDMPAVYGQHDICVLPSSSEPLGTAPLEGMAHGCVPIVSDECGSAGYILGEDCGSIVKAGDVSSLCDALAPLLANPEKIAILGERARTVAENKFNKRLFVQRVERLAQSNASARSTA